MLKTPPRPRAPSAATLRVLYQLAYISSGTALGVGALCAEERRRRTQIVQRIADNAKRIRQSPRYARGAATAAAVREEEYSSAWMPEYGDRADQSVKSAELPSVVEREYGQVVEKNHKRVRRRRRTGRPEFVEAHEAAASATQSEKPSDSAIRPRPRTEGHGVRPQTTVKHLLSDVARFQRRPRQGAWGLATRSDENDLECITARPVMIHAMRSEQNHRSPRSVFETYLSRYKTRHLWTSQIPSNNVDPSEESRSLLVKSLSQDVDLFFSSVTMGTISHISLLQACNVADQLLTVALSLGSYHDAQSLLLWKISIKKLERFDVSRTIDALPQLAQHVSAEELLAFYDDLLATFRHFDGRQQTQQHIHFAFLASMLRLERSEEYDDAIETLLERLESLVGGYRSSAKALEHCQSLLEQGFLTGAFRLFRLASKLSGESDALPKTSNLLFDRALKAGSLSLCAQILVMKRHMGFTEYQGSQMDEFVQLCSSAGAHGMLRDLFRCGRRSKHTGLDHKGLSVAGQALLCEAFAQDNRSSAMFSYFYRRLPFEARVSSSSSHVEYTARAMKADWKTTRNFQKIEKVYDRLRSWATSNSVNSSAMLPVHVAFAEILISANNPRPALELLATSHASNPEARVGYTVALAFAKQRDWTSFQKLLERISEAGSEARKSGLSTRDFNNALHLYSQSHSADETSTLLRWAMDKLDFVPNKATWHITFSCFISEKNLQLVRDWLYMPAGSGQPVQMDEGIAATMMKRWYTGFRHSHVMIMWFCRALQQSAPTFTGTGLLNLVRESIGYDLRSNHGINAAWLEPLILRRKTLVDEAGQYLPKPGYVWNGALYDNGKPLSHIEPPQEDHQAKAAQLSENAGSGSDEDFNRVVEAYNADGAHDSTIGDSDQQSTISGQEPVPADASSGMEIGFTDLRPAYAPTQSGVNADDFDYDPTELNTLERNMILALSLGRFEDVLDMYHNSLDAVKLPASPVALEVAVEASIRLTGDRAEAERILTAAQTAGMNVSCAVGPLLIDQIRDCGNMDLDQARNIRMTAVEYYRMNEENGWHVKHFVGTQAAHALIQAGYADHGLNLLSSIFNSQYAAERPLDIAAMSVWLLGYAAMRHMKGMEWVVRTVLAQDMPIDRGFLAAINRAKRPRTRDTSGTVVYARQQPGVSRRLMHWRHVCGRRRAEQMQESKVFGRKLVNLLARTSNRQERERVAKEERKRQRLQSLGEQVQVDPTKEHHAEDEGSEVAETTRQEESVLSKSAIGH